MNQKAGPGFFLRIPETIAKHRLIWALALLAATILLGAGIPRLTIDMSTESFFLEDDPVKITYQQFREHFGSDEFVFIVYRAKDGDVFSSQSLDALADIHAKLEAEARQNRDNSASAFSRITDITSLINVSYLEGADDTLRSRDFVGDMPVESDPQRVLLKRQAREHPDYIPSMLNRQGDFGVIVIDTDIGAREVGQGETEEDLLGDDAFQESAVPEGPPQFVRPNFWDYQGITNALQERLDRSAAAEHLQFYPVGNPVIMKFFADVFITEVTFLSLMSVVFIILVFYLLFRTVRSVIGALLIVVTAIVWTLGIAGWAGVFMTLMVTVIIFLTLTVGVADAVHLLSGYMYMRREGMAHAQAVREVFRTSGPACFLTSITTMIGLMSLVVIPIVPFKIFGIFAGLGVFLAFVFTMLILPLTITEGKTGKMEFAAKRKPHPVQRVIRRLEPLVYKAPLAVSLLFIALAIVFFWGLTKVRVDTNFGQLISHRNIIRQNIDTVEENIGGTMGMEILVETRATDGLKDPLLLQAMADLQAYLEEEHKRFVVSSHSLADAVKESFKALNEDRPEMHVIPETKPMLAQTLLLFEGAAADDRAKLVTDDYENARISVRIRNRGSFEYIPFMADTNRKIEAIFAPLKETYPDLRVEITGVFALTMKLADFVSWSQIKSFSLALGVISVLFIFVFRSVKGGLISILPNLFPIIVAFGMMGFMGYSLDLDTLLVAPIAIGIAVDDTIHFLTRYRMEQAAGAEPKEAVRHTYREVGQAMVFTSLILSAGFLMFTFCQHNGLSHFGLLSATAIISAAISDLFFLPRLCILTNLRFTK